LVLDLRDGTLPRRLDAAGLRRLQQLLPSLLAALGADDDALVMTRRMLRVIEAIGGRSSYFALLNENPAARARFMAVCRGGDFLVAQLAAHPLLLDELLDERSLIETPDRAELAADLEDRLARVSQDDPEQLVEALAQFKNAAVFRVAIADITGRLAVMHVSDRLTDIAELVIEQALRQGWAQMTAQFGVPTWRESEEAEPHDVEVCAVGYGKLGGMELGYGSDLDLVFLHDSHGMVQETRGERPLDNQLFFVRLAQRIVHILTVHSRAGRLYEVDTRLRPSGKGGMLVTGIGAFADYQRGEAWTWEHQALLHARTSGAGAVCPQCRTGRTWCSRASTTAPTWATTPSIRAPWRLRWKATCSGCGPSLSPRWTRVGVNWRLPPQRRVPRWSRPWPAAMLAPGS
jgi:glutamate-ammonia-ligase adenylyltransferase